MGKKSAKTKRKKMSTKKKIIISSIVLLLVGISTAFLIYYNYVKNKIYTEYKPTPVAEEKKETEYTEVDGITNILLIGTDGRDVNERARADSIIIATLDNNNKEIRLTSLFRDTLVYIPGHGEAKLNAAMAYGGKDLLIDTIKETYGIKLDKFMIINFWGFEAVIDEIGGLEIDVKDYQLKELNKYIGESTGGNDCPVTETGVQLLNGKQALSYARIRKGVGDEYERTERQREVLFKIAEKVRETKPSRYLGIMNTMLDHISTNIEPMEALNLAYTIFKFPTLETKQIHMPVTDLAYDLIYKNIGFVFVMDREQNSKILKDFIFNDVMPDRNNFDYDSFNKIIAEYKQKQAIYEGRSVSEVKVDTTKISTNGNDKKNEITSENKPIQIPQQTEDIKVAEKEETQDKIEEVQQSENKLEQETQKPNDKLEQELVEEDENNDLENSN